MSVSRLLFVSVAVLGFAAPAFAGVEETYSPGPSVTTPWYAPMSEAQRAADLDFITGMRPHHAGALSMSEEYLSGDEPKNALLAALARGIIHNQKFEIGMMDHVEKLVRAADANSGTMQRLADLDLVQQKKFYRAAVPGPLDGWGKNTDVSKRDVIFAKAMIVHHAGALMMAEQYLASDSDNGYLRQMCLDILKDQSNEISFMKGLLRKYPGNADDVKITPDMIDGMDHMMKTMPGLMSAAQLHGEPMKMDMQHGMDHDMGHGSSGHSGHHMM